MKFSNLWCVNYYPSGKDPGSLIVKKQLCNSLEIACKVVEELTSLDNHVSSIEHLDCIIDF